MDLTSLSTLLLSFGVGPIAAAAISAVAVVVVNRLRDRFAPKPAPAPVPVDPSKPVDPVPSPAPQPSNAPLLDALLAFLREKLRRKAEAKNGDIDADDVVEVVRAVK